LSYTRTHNVTKWAKRSMLTAEGRRSTRSRGFPRISPQQGGPVRSRMTGRSSSSRSTGTSGTARTSTPTVRNDTRPPVSPLANRAAESKPGWARPRHAGPRRPLEANGSVEDHIHQPDHVIGRSPRFGRRERPRPPARAAAQSVLAARGARPFTFTASASSTSQPSRSCWSWTKRAPAAGTGIPAGMERRPGQRGSEMTAGFRAQPGSSSIPASISAAVTRITDS